MIFTRTKENEVHSTQAISTKILRVSMSGKTADAFLHEVFLAHNDNLWSDAVAILLSVLKCSE